MSSKKGKIITMLAVTAATVVGTAFVASKAADKNEEQFFADHAENNGFDFGFGFMPGFQDMSQDLQPDEELIFAKPPVKQETVESSTPDEIDAPDETVEADTEFQPEPKRGLSDLFVGTDISVEKEIPTVSPEETEPAETAEAFDEEPAEAAEAEPAAEISEEKPELEELPDTEEEPAEEAAAPDIGEPEQPEELPDIEEPAEKMPEPDESYYSREHTIFVGQTLVSDDRNNQILTAVAGATGIPAERLLLLAAESMMMCFEFSDADCRIPATLTNVFFIEGREITLPPAEERENVLAFGKEFIAAVPELADFLK